MSDAFERPAKGPGASLDVRGTRSWRRTVRGYLLLPHLAPVLVVELATAAFAVIAWGGLPPAASSRAVAPGHARRSAGDRRNQ